MFNKIIHSVILIVAIQILPGNSGILSAQNSIDKVLQVKQYTEDFEVAGRFIHNNYAWFDDKVTDWNRVYDHFLPLAQKSRTETEFIRVLEQVLEQMYDHHTHLGVNTSASPRMVPSGTDICAEFQDDKIFITSVRGDSGAEHNGVRAGMEILSVGGVPVMKAVTNRIPATIEDPDSEVMDWALQSTLAGYYDKLVHIEVRSGDQIRKVEFQPGLYNQTESLLATDILDGNTGYIQIHNSLGNMDLIKEWDRALEELQDTDALILDLRNTPGGGNSTVARGIMSRLISETKPYQLHEIPAEKREFGVKRIWTELVAPRGPFTYTQPVAVLVNRWTGSMGEGLAIGLDGMARATVIGTPMAGLKGALYSHTLPHTGIEIRIPSERLYHIDGTPREEFMPAVLVWQGDGIEDLLEHALKVLRD